MAQERQRRWYDRDPLLSMAMKTLENSSDGDQIRLALHLIKIINEHNIEQGGNDKGNGQAPYKTGSSRWYDLDQTLKTSIEMLRCCSPELQRIVAREMAQKLNEYMAAEDNSDNA
jgi:hypothetical protein